MKQRHRLYRNKIFLFPLLVILALMLSGCGCSPKSPTYKVNLEVWGLFDDSDVFVKAIQEYKERNPRIGNIDCKKLTVDSYENDFRDALATGRGPDIFLIHHTWLTKHSDKLAPAPAQTKNISNEDIAFITPKKVQDDFPDVVFKDFVKDSNVYALPISVDSLALYYNKDYLNQAGITRPPETWEEFDAAVQKMTKVDSFGNVETSGAAMGLSSDRSDNPGGGKINRATDILTLIMMQAGTEIYDSKKNAATFAEFPESFFGKEKSPGEMALEYYTKFSDPASGQYSWNSRMHNSIDAFIEGKTAMTINYSWLIPRVQDKSPKLNLGTSFVPQNKTKDSRGIDVDVANYWGFAVSKNRTFSEEEANLPTAATNEQRIEEAWKFIVYFTMRPSDSSVFLKEARSKESSDFDPAAEYAEKQKKPAARLDLIEKQKEDLLLSPFVKGNLISKTWPDPDNLAIERIFDEMIDDVALRNENTREVLRQGQNSVNLLIKK